MEHLADSTQLKRIKADVAAGQTTQTTDSVDTLGYQGVRLVALIGTIAATGTVTVKMQYSDDDTNWTTAAESIDYTAADDDKLAVVDLMPPPGRYVRLQITRGTANSAVLGAFADLYRGIEQPAAADDTEMGRLRYIGTTTI